MAKINTNKPVTNGMLNQAVDAILEGMNNLYLKHDQKFDNVDQKMDKVEKRLSKIEYDVHFIKRDVKDIKIELTDVPTAKDFLDLKSKVINLQV